MGIFVYLFSIIVLSQVVLPNTPLAVDCMGRPKISGLQPGKMDGQDSRSAIVFRRNVPGVTSQHSPIMRSQKLDTVTKKGYSYTTPSVTLPPMGNYR